MARRINKKADHKSPFQSVPTLDSSSAATPDPRSNIRDPESHAHYSGFIETTIISALAPFPEIDLIILFGSAVDNTLRTNSDINIAITSKSLLTSERKIAYTNALSVQLERPIDLIDLHTAQQPLVSSVLSTGKLLLNRNPDSYATILRRLWRWNEDMSQNHDSFLAQRRATAFSL